MKALQFSVNTARFIAARAAAALLGDRVFYSGPLRTVRLAEIPEPDLPSQEWVKIQTIYCGFCGSDMNLIRLHDSPTASPFTSFPCVMGHEIVGKIVEAGSDSGEFKPGDLVTINPALACDARGISPLCPSCQAGRIGSCENVAEGDLAPGMFTGINGGVNGGFAPFFVAHKSQLFKVPEGVSPEAAVMTEPFSVALQAVFDNVPLPEEQVLVIGGGVIGSLVVRSLRVLEKNCHISLIEPSAFASGFAMAMGGDEVIPLKQVFPQTSRITGAKVYKPLLGMEVSMGGFHRIYDTVGIAKTLNLSLRLLKAMGTLSVIGIGGNVKLDLTPLWLKIQNIKGVYSSGMVTFRREERAVFDVALQLMRDGEIEAEKLVTHRFRLEDYRKMIEVNKNKSKYRAVKTVVSFLE